jgi:SAM-dependent methyltransferase
MSFAPIVLFVYNRPVHTQRAIESILKNPESRFSKIYIFSDGPKPGQEAAVEQVRNFARNVTGFMDGELIIHDNNLGLVKSTWLGLDYVCERHGSFIMVEDDLQLSSKALAYLNYNLQRFEKDERIASISLYNYPVENVFTDGGGDVFCVKGADCWGFATWSKRWLQAERDPEILTGRIEEKLLQFEFDRYGAYPYFKMLRDQIGRDPFSWSIRWYASEFLSNRFTLFPRKTMSLNLGLDGSGVNCGPAPSYSDVLSEDFSPVLDGPIESNDRYLYGLYKFLGQGRLFHPQIDYPIQINSVLKLATMARGAGDILTSQNIVSAIASNPGVSQDVVETMRASLEFQAEPELEGVYTDYQENIPGSARAASAIVPIVVADLKIDSVLDVGCGAGEFLAEFIRLGITDHLGLDGHLLRNQLNPVVKNYKQINLARKFDFHRKFSIACCLEVAEHIPSDSAENLISSLCGHADVVLFSAAIPFQGGEGHVSEQWPSYWYDLFHSEGYLVCDYLRTIIWDILEVPYWYRQNVLLFVRESLLPGLPQRLISSVVHHERKLVLDKVHPEAFLSAVRAGSWGR